ncbi:MAG: S8 family serine peptidase, partial [Candidatus Sigynarchaeota archaeon]
MDPWSNQDTRHGDITIARWNYRSPGNNYISCWLVRILVRIIAQFKTNEDMATFVARHCKNDEAEKDGKTQFHVVHKLVLAPIIILEAETGPLDENALDAALAERTGIESKERETELFLSRVSASSILDMDVINSSIYGPFQGDGLTIAIIDGGIDAAHPDLAGREIKRKEYLDTARGLDAGHGTSIAGIICGSGAMSRGRFKGMARKVSIMDCVAFDKNGRGLLGDVLAAIDVAVGIGIKIICMPFSSRPGVVSSTIFECYLRVLSETRSTFFCCGAGNHGPLQGTIGMPGCFECVLTTGSTSINFKVSVFSGRGNPKSTSIKPEFCLPCEHVVSLNVEKSSWKDSILDENEYYAAFTGNSVSVAILTGLVAAILSAKPDAKPSAVKQLLAASCVRMRKFAPISAGKGIVAATSVFRNMDMLYTFTKGFTTITREAAI